MDLAHAHKLHTSRNRVVKTVFMCDREVRNKYKVFAVSY